MSPTACKLCRRQCAALLALFMMIVLPCCLSGCGAEDKERRSKEQELFDKGVLTMNNISIEELEDNTGFAGSSFRISGLCDKAVEERVNSEINELYQSMKSGEYIPAYRGMAVKLREVEGIEPRVQAYMYPEFNACNILSVLGGGWVSYVDSDGEPLFYYFYDCTLNFDLTTGEQLALGDLFAPGEDCIGTLSDIVDDMLLRTNFDGGGVDDDYYGFEDVPMTAPFKGIKPEQKYYIDTNGDIMLIMDDATPEFYTEYMPKTLPVYSKDLTGRLALYRKPSGPLYENTETVYNIARDNSDSYRVSLEYESEQNEIKPNYYNYSDISLPKNLPDPVRKSVDAVLGDTSVLPVNPEAVYEDMAARYGGDGWMMNTSSRVTCERVRYTDALNVVIDWNYHTGTDSDGFGYDTEKGASYKILRMFDMNSGEIIPPEKLFTHPEKMDEILKNAIVSGLVDRNGADRAQAEAAADDLIGHINGACLSGEGLILSYDLPNEELYGIGENMFGDPDNSFSYYLSLSQPGYRDIGCENLIVFSGK